MKSKNDARIHIIVGHYGSGKTEFAINYALWLKQSFERVYLVDLDIVNPYFRTNDAAPKLSALGLSVIASAYAGSNVDVPSLPSEIQRVFVDQNAAVVFDVGGDDDGAVALGRYKPYFDKEKTEMLFVLNAYRPMTTTKEAVCKMIADIEAASRQKITALVNSSNLAELSTATETIQGQKLTDEVSRITNIPCRYVAATESVINDLPEDFSPDVFPIKRFMALNF